MTIERASDNPFPSILLVEHADPADVSTPGAGQRRLSIDDAGGLYLVDHDLVATAIGAGGGGGGGGGRLALDSYDLDPTYGDDFDGASLAGIWTRRNFSGGAETYQLGPLETFMRIAATGRSAGDGYFQPAPAGDWTFAMSYIVRYAAVPPTWGICCIDASGTGVSTEFATVGPGAQALIVGGVTTYSTYAASFQQTPSTTSLTPPVLEDHKIWVYLRKAGTDYFGAYSLDGEVWSPETPAFSSGITVDRVGMLAHPQATFVTTQLIDVDLFNKIA